MIEKKKEEKLSEALMKVALGYQLAEVTEEFSEVNGELKLTKRKKTKKDIPPDLKAVQLLLTQEGGEEYGAWSDEELEREKERLLSALQAAAQEAAREKPVKKTVKSKKSVVKKTAKKTVKTAKKGGGNGV